MGLQKLLRNNANGVEWAYEATKMCQQWFWMGPLKLLRNVADGV